MKIGINFRSKGQVIPLVAVMMVFFLALGALLTDVGILYSEKAKMSKAADAAALAGALRLPNTTDARNAALNYTSLNGYTNGTRNITVTTTLNPDGSHPNWYQVVIAKPYQLWFARLTGLNTTTVRAAATAEYIPYQPINIYGNGAYGTTGVQALEISGPYGRHDYGDPYSTRYLDGDAYSNNPEYDANGYNFRLYVPSNYSTINGTSTCKLELYDPYMQTNSSSIDEKYNSHGSNYSSDTTVFTIYQPDATPHDYSDDIQVATHSYGSTSSTTYLKKWDTADFSFNTTTYGTGYYRVNVRSTNGSGGNAFQMRAGPPRSGSTAFNPNNGTAIEANQHLQIFFTSAGTVNFSMGYIPPEAAGAKVHIRNFDTDVGAVSANYHDNTGQINWTGQLSTNDTWRENVFTVPSGYPGGTLTATYTAGANDTSIWEMWYEGVNIQAPGAKVKLVR